MKVFYHSTIISLLAAIVLQAAPVIAGDSGFYEKDCRSQPVEVCEAGSQTISKTRFTILAYGGSDKLYQAAVRALKRFQNDHGVDTAIIRAPDRDTIDISMHVDFYTNGGTQYYVTAYDNHKNPIEETEKGLYDQAVIAYEAEYGQLSNVDKPVQEKPSFIATLFKYLTLQ